MKGCQLHVSGFAVRGVVASKLTPMTNVGSAWNRAIGRSSLVARKVELVGPPRPT
jgi:hypothetical protein